MSVHKDKIEVVEKFLSTIREEKEVELKMPLPESELHQLSIDALKSKLLEARRTQHMLKQYSDEEFAHLRFVDEATAIIEYKNKLQEKAGDLRDPDVHSKMTMSAPKTKLEPTASEKERAAQRIKKKSLLGKIFGESEIEGADNEDVSEAAPIVVMPAPIHIRNPQKKSQQKKSPTAYQQGIAAQGKPYNNPYQFDPKAGSDVNYDHNQYRAGYKKQGISEESLEEKKLTPAELKKREEIAKAIERDNPDMPMGKKMAIATATAKKVAESEELEEAVKLGSRVIVHAPGKSYHGKTGYVGEIRHGLYKGAPKKYTIDHDGGSTQLDKKNIRLYKEDVEHIDEASEQQILNFDHASAKAYNATKAAKTKSDHEKAQKLHKAAAGLGLSSDQEYTHVQDHLMWAKHHATKMNESEELEELNKETLKNYISKADGDFQHQHMVSRFGTAVQKAEALRKKKNRQSGISQAYDKLKEDSEQLDELSLGTITRALRAREKKSSDILRDQSRSFDEKMPDYLDSEKKLSRTISKSQDKHIALRKAKREANESELGEQTAVAPSLVKHRIGVTVSDPYADSVSKRKEKTQKFVHVTHSSDKEGARKVAEKAMKKRGYTVHDSWHVKELSWNESEELDELTNRPKLERKVAAIRHHDTYVNADDETKIKADRSMARVEKQGEKGDAKLDRLVKKILFSPRQRNESEEIEDSLNNHLTEEYKVGDKVHVRGGGVDSHGKIEKVEDRRVLFRHENGKLYGVPHQYIKGKVE